MVVGDRAGDDHADRDGLAAPKPSGRRCPGPLKVLID